MTNANHDQPYESEYRDLGSLHSFRTEIPNILFEMSLDVYEFSVYCYLKRIAGDKGGCWKSSKKICEDIGISTPKLIEVKKSLESRGLIKIEKRKDANGGTIPDLVSIIDIWSLNMSIMIQRAQDKKGGGKPQLGGGVNAVNGGGKCHLPKEEQYKEDPYKEQQQQYSQPSGLAKNVAVSFKNKIYDCLKKIDIPESDKIEICNNYDEATVKHGIAYATHSSTKITKSLAAAIKWACKNKPEIPISQEDLIQKNRDIAMKYDEKENPNRTARIVACSKHVEINTVGVNAGFTIEYVAKDFIEKFFHLLRSYNFQIPRTA